MKLGILSDVHANEEALCAVLEDARRRGLDELVCLGDCVGYGAAPVECLELLAESCSVVIAGNHDHAACGLISDENFNQAARASLAFTRERLSSNHQSLLRQLPLKVEHDSGLLLVHASPYLSEQFPYIMDAEDAEVVFRSLEFKAAVHGHSHVAVSFRWQDDHAVASLNPRVEVGMPGSYLINVGSVGQPRDRDQRASYAVYDTDTEILHRHRVEYDCELASRRIREAGLPDFLARRLLVGV